MNTMPHYSEKDHYESYMRYYHSAACLSKDKRLRLDLADGHRVSMKAERIQIQISTELKQRMGDLLGDQNYQMITQFPKTP